MADDTDSDPVLHFKRRIIETDGNQETTVKQETSNALSTQPNLYEFVFVSKDDREITPVRFVSNSLNCLSKKVKWSPEFDSEGKKGLYEHVNGGGTAGIGVNDLDFEKMEQMKDLAKDGDNKSVVQEGSGNSEVVEDNKSVVQECTQGLAVYDSSLADDKQELKVKEIGYDGFLSKFKENKFLEGPEVETQLVNLSDLEGSGEILGDTIEGIDGSMSNVVEYEGESVDGFKGSDGSVRCSLKIEVIDDTALIENDKKNVKEEVDGRKEKRQRRRGKGVKKGPAMNEMPICSAYNVEASNGGKKIGNGSNKLYSRKEMEALRFVDVKEQKKKWYEVYCGLGPIVSKEYDDLVYSVNHKHIGVNFDPQQRLGKNYEASALAGGGCSQDVDDEIKIKNDNEMDKLNYLDPSCDQIAGIKDGYSAPEEECSEDSDGDGYYDSIHRPAFFVEGEPNFDSGPPEDGLEYLRRVRWEAARIPKVKVVNIGKNKLNKEQSVYMPSIPEIAKCPEHLLPSKQWEDVFLADFEELRLTLSRLEGPGPENSVSETSRDYPTVSTILGMDYVARVSMLRRRISSVDTMTTLSRSECVWLFALCAAVDTPLDADMSAALRCLLRKCASLRAKKSELDDEVVMLNILATISGRYFGQAEN